MSTEQKKMFKFFVEKQLFNLNYSLVKYFNLIKLEKTNKLTYITPEEFILFLRIAASIDSIKIKTQEGEEPTKTEEIDGVKVPIEQTQAIIKIFVDNSVNIAKEKLKTAQYLESPVLIEYLTRFIDGKF